MGTLALSNDNMRTLLDARASLRHSALQEERDRRLAKLAELRERGEIDRFLAALQQACDSDGTFEIGSDVGVEAKRGLTGVNFATIRVSKNSIFDKKTGIFVARHWVHKSTEEVVPDIKRLLRQQPREATDVAVLEFWQLVSSCVGTAGAAKS